MNITNEELLKLATKIEGEGKNFYLELSKYIENPEVKDFLLLMAKEESMHEIQFKKLLDEKGDLHYGWEKNESLRELIDTQFQTDIFPPLEEVFKHLPKFQGIKKAIDFAVEAEKVSSEFYGLLQEACTDIESKTILVLMEKAEQEHLERVEMIRDRYLAESSENKSS